MKYSKDDVIRNTSTNKKYRVIKVSDDRYRIRKVGTVESFHIREFGRYYVESPWFELVSRQSVGW